jgi:hypothetical protein
LFGCDTKYPLSPVRTARPFLPFRTALALGRKSKPPAF